MRGLIAWTVVALLMLSVTWTTWKTRQILRRSLGRKLKSGEDSSLRTWMQFSDESLDNASRELERDPFDRVLRFLARLRLWDPPPPSGSIGK